MESSHWAEPAVNDADSFPPADVHSDVLGRRLLASIVDSIILALVVFGVAAATHGLHTQTATTPTGYHAASVGLSPGATLLALVGMMLYYFGFESLTGQTLGKMATGLQVVTVDGRAASVGAILIRTLGRLIDALPVFYLVGFVSLLCGSAPRKRVGDRMAGTTVAPV
jgi:uncharacterized RDD family membrane protein YckC